VSYNDNCLYMCLCFKNQNISIKEVSKDDPYKKGVEAAREAVREISKEKAGEIESNDKKEE